jgi:hypothetical protein
MRDPTWRRILPWILVLLAGGVLWGQLSPEEEKELLGRLTRVEERLDRIEQALAGRGEPPSAGRPTAPDASFERLERRVDRIEQQSLSYRPGTPSSSLQIESRLSALEREVSRLRNR